MVQDELSEKIRELVDHLRSSGAGNFGLADIASVTEVLITTMGAYFRSIDTSIYREFKDITDYLDNARDEIAKLSPGDLENVRIPRAGHELDAIVQATETATNTIMEAAETIMSCAPDNEKIQDACMNIFEACSFQDITGQRISKVVATLEYVESRISDLKTLLRVEDRTDTEVSLYKMDGGVELQGPALEGEGMEQSAIDALLAGDSPEESSEAAPAATEAAAPKAEEAAPEPERPKAAPKSKEPKAAPKSKEPKAAPKSKEPKAAPKAAKANGTNAPSSDDGAGDGEGSGSEDASQADIDALFD